MLEKQKVFDCFMFNGENIILDIRLNVLDKYVDYFVIVESNYNFSGKKKKNYLILKILKSLKIKLFIFLSMIFQKKQIIFIIIIDGGIKITYGINIKEIKY